MRRILPRLARAQVFGAFIHNRSVPVRLAEHGEAEGDKVLVGERGVDSIRHIGSSILWSHEKRAAVARRPAVNTVCISPVWER